MREIFESVKMNHIELKNRLIRSATWEGIANPDGSVTEEAYEIYRELAKGGVGAIITGFTSVALHDYYFGGMMRLCDDALIPQYRDLTHTGALLVGTYDNFTDGDPANFLRNLNDHMPTARDNQLIFIEKTGHTYQMKHQEVADDILRQIQEGRCA